MKCVSWNRLTGSFWSVHLQKKNGSLEPPSRREITPKSTQTANSPLVVADRSSLARSEKNVTGFKIKEGSKKNVVPPHQCGSPTAGTRHTGAADTHDMRWAPLAALCCSYASCLSAAAAFCVLTPTATGVRRVLGREVCLARARAATMALPLRMIRVPPARPVARRVFQQRMMASSTSEQQQQAEASATAKRRASSRYIPSDFRGVRGGPKGKWKARLVSKGQLRQLGTFE